MRYHGAEQQEAHQRHLKSKYHATDQLSSPPPRAVRPAGIVDKPRLVPVIPQPRECGMPPGGQRPWVDRHWRSHWVAVDSSRTEATKAPSAGDGVRVAQQGLPNIQATARNLQAYARVHWGLVRLEGRWVDIASPAA
jgi:hypothetical protein